MNHPAAALFEDRKLVRAARVRLPITLKRLPVGERCRRIAKLIAETTEQWAGGKGRIRHAVIEWPRTYGHGKSKGDSADLFPLAAIGCAVGALLDVEITSYLPQEWIGQVRKFEKGDPWESPRGQMIARRLSENERECVTDSHDAIDAVGIGLKYLGRLEPVRVFPGATPG